ncbi:hypothetical protein OG389_03025 [Streptomyces sp. NBC_00435]|uniref:hypothetical protein n=1 Tax=Streptomyces sp. NBC_00435 TaxID=2903649 RepID=UPI002E1EBF47
MTVVATFGVARIVESDLLTVEPGVIEAARSMGAGPLRILLTVLVPEALGARASAQLLGNAVSRKALRQIKVRKPLSDSGSGWQALLLEA